MRRLLRRLNRQRHVAARLPNRWHSLWSIRFQLLLAVNVTMAILVAALLVLDYRQELEHRLAQKQVSLEHEAKTLLPAVLRLREGSRAIQAHLNSVCGSVCDGHESDPSPRHHIGVRLGEIVIQSTARRRGSPEIFRLMEQASASSERRAEFGQRELVIGSSRQGDVAVYVSEDTSLLRRSALRHILWRLAGVVALGLVAAGVVNVVLRRIVVRPLRRLVSTVHQIAGGDLAVRTDAFNSAELTRLSDAINAMSASLGAADRERRREMAKAQQIQKYLLPEPIEVAGLDVTALYRPAADVGGDYYDVIRLPDETWLLCVADVCGHGVPAAMSAAMLKGFLLHAVEHFVEPDELLRFINERFAACSPPGMFASMLLVRWDAEAARLEYASAGHEPAWHLSTDGRLRALEATGLFLGIDPTLTWTTPGIELSPGDRVLLVTDGVSETFNARQEQFGRERLSRLLLEGQHLSIEQLAARIDECLARYRGEETPADDMTLLAVEFFRPLDSVPQSGHYNQRRSAQEMTTPA